MLGQLRRSERSRDHLARRAVDASEEERRRIAGSLHDGVVQDLAGASFVLAANWPAPGPLLPSRPRPALDAVRQSIGGLRSLLVELYPPSLDGAGLAAALTDGRLRCARAAPTYASTCPTRSPSGRPAATEVVLFRAAQEAVRNVAKHADVCRVEVVVRLERSRVELVVRDDGRGFDPVADGVPRAEGHVGLQVVADVVAEAGGSAELRPPPGGGPPCASSCRCERGPGAAGRRPPAGPRRAGDPARAAGRPAVVGEAGDGAEASSLAAGLAPDVVLMDLSMPVLDGIAATRRVAAEHPGTSVLVLTSFSDRERVTDALDAGAVGYVLKDSEPAVVLAAVRAVAAGRVAARPAGGPYAARRPPHRPRSPSSRTGSARSWGSWRAGMANKQIARASGSGESTVKAHLTSVFAAIGVRDRTAAALWAQRNLT